MAFIVSFLLRSTGISSIFKSVLLHIISVTSDDLRADLTSQIRVDMLLTMHLDENVIS